MTSQVILTRLHQTWNKCKHSDNGEFSQTYIGMHANDFHFWNYKSSDMLDLLTKTLDQTYSTIMEINSRLH